MAKPETVVKIYEALTAHYGSLNWWPAKTPYEVMVGAILTQNTAWHNVEKAIANFGDSLSPHFVLSADIDDLIDIIRPAGFFNQKAVYLKAMTEWFSRYNFDTLAAKDIPLNKLRRELLAVRGIGKETADCILLYALELPTFVIDAYTVRLCERVGIDADKGYDALKAFFEKNLPKSVEIFNNYHALIVINGKDHCRKSKPICGTCPLKEMCDYAYRM